jgi:hypothetical protein
MDRLKQSELLGELNGKLFLSTAMAWDALSADDTVPTTGAQI